MIGTRLASASAVAWQGRGLLILGAPGSGKSSLAIELVALGARMIADDVVPLALRDGALFASPPQGFEGMVEARGIGLLTLPIAEGATRIALALDLDEIETERLPGPRLREIAGAAIPLLRRPDPLRAGAIAMTLAAGGPTKVE